MTHKSLCLAILLAVLFTTAAQADGPPSATPGQETSSKPLAVVRTIVYLPFKGVVCVVGAVASFPVYVLSGLDPQVKSDTEALRAEYCSRDYLLGPDWTK